MRSSLLGASLLGLMLATGCTVGDSGGANSDDGVTSDDGASDGDGSITPDATPLPDPVLAGTVDKLTLNTELMSTSMITLTVQGSNGFMGTATIVPSVVDATGAPLVGWSLTVDSPSVTLPLNGSATVVATLVIPSESTALAGKIKFDISGAVAPALVSTDVTVANQISLATARNGDTCTFPADATTKIKVGTKVRFVNAGTTGRIIFHIDPGTGMNHESGLNDATDGTPPGQAYVQTPNDTSGPTGVGWYCHSHTTTNNRIIVE